MKRVWLDLISQQKLLCLLTYCFMALTSLSTHAQVSTPRIVTLSPHLAEIVAEVGGISQLVGVAAYSNYPSAVKPLPVVGDYQSLNLELLKQLQPDIILIWTSGTPANQQAKLQALFKNTSTRIIQSDALSLDAIPLEIKRIGQIIGHEAQAQQVSRHFQSELQKIRQSQVKKTPISVFFQAWSSPLMTLQEDHLISDMIKLCGGVPIFSQEKIQISAVSIEAVIAKNPEVIMSASESQSNGNLQDFDQWKKYSNLKANRLNGYLSINGDWLTRPSSRALLASHEICRFFDIIRAKRS